MKDRKKDPAYKVKAKARTSETENLPESSSGPDANVLFPLEDFDTPLPLAELERGLTLQQLNWSVVICLLTSDSVYGRKPH